MNKKNNTIEEDLNEQEEQINKAKNNVNDDTENADERRVEEQLEEALKQEKDKFLRLFAEFENFKKRTSKERIELFKTASQDVMTAMLPILDDFDRAYNEISKTKDKNMLKGVELIGKKFRDTLQQKGLAQMEVEQGDTFNADLHEAVTQIPAPSDDMKGKIIDVIEKGYKLGDRIIRFPKVIIGQ